MSEELKPCPICGGDAETGDGFLPMESIVYVWCKNHECLMSNGVDIGFGVDEWNRRHEDKRVAELEAELADLKVSYQTLKWESEDNFKRSAQYANEAEVRKAELADLKESVRHLISDAHISGFVLEGQGERSIMYFVKGKLIDDLKKSLIQDDDK